MFHSDDIRVRVLTKPNHTAGAGASNVVLKMSKRKIGKGSIFGMYGTEGRQKGAEIVVGRKGGCVPIATIK